MLKRGDSILSVCSDFRDRRLDWVPSATRRPEALHLFGTDNMDTNDVFSYFAAFNPTTIEWVNLSSCELKFRITANHCLVKTWGE